MQEALGLHRAQQKSENAGHLDGNQKVMATRAYQQWLLNKKVEQQQKNKGMKIQQELEVLHAEQMKMEQEQAQLIFTSWKRNKDMERGLKFESNKAAKNIFKVEDTPLLPGYCSVWSCDEELADHMLTRVPRDSLKHAY